MRILSLLSVLIIWVFGLSGQSFVPSNRFDQIKELVTTHHMDWKTFDSIVDQMVRAYLNDTATIHALLSQLDPYSVYYDSMAYVDLRSDLSGTFGGVGLAFSIIENKAFISEVFAGAPAVRAGMAAGDQIVKVDTMDCTTIGQDYWPLIQALRGTVGTSVRVEVINRKGEKKAFDIVREQIVMPSVPAAFMIDKHIGYIKIASFTDKTAADVHERLMQLNKAGMQKLILDLRDNPGGYMKQATRIADEFLAEGKLMVYTEGREGRNDVIANAGGIFEQGEVAVLVNALTASSGEILTAALQGNDRAVIYGTRTFGKGLVQRIYAISDSTEAVKLTTEKYFTPRGVCIQQPYTGSTYVYDRNDEILTHAASGATSAISDVIPEWGITPDVSMSSDAQNETRLLDQLQEREYIVHAAILYFRAHYLAMLEYTDVGDFLKSYAVSDTVLTFIDTQIRQWEKNADGMFPPLAYTQDELMAESAVIRSAFKSYLARMLYGDAGFYQVVVQNDTVVDQALEGFGQKNRD